MSLPDYTAINLNQKNEKNILREVALSFAFPLSKEDLIDIKLLEEKFDSEDTGVGLAAPQLGISKKACIIHVPDDPKLKRFRLDLIQSMNKTTLLNPSYTPATNETHADYEACFSVKDYAGLVKRYTKINYEFYNIKGNLISDSAEGFLARVIQHEVDHLNGILFIDRTDNIIPMEEYKKIRAKKIAEIEP